MQKGLFSSLLLHITIIVIATLGLPFIKKDLPPIVMTPISIEMVDIAEKTQSPEPLQAKKTPPAQNLAEAPPDLSQKMAELEPPKPDPTPKIEEKPEPVPAPPKEEPKKEEKKKEEPKKEEPKKEVTKKEDQPAPDPFASLLKNLTPDETEESPKQIPDQTAEDSKTDTPPAPNLGQQLTISEKDALLAQLAQCWNVLSGGKNAETLVIEVELKLNPDRTINSTRIVDNARYNRDSAFRAAADSAVRALRNPKCIPLNLPPDKYNEWKNTTITFDPRQML